MDSDALKRKEDYRRILGDFRTGKTDILVGTQMIAKGLHFPNVTLVGIVYAGPGPAHARFPRRRADISIVDASGRARRPGRRGGRSFSCRPSPPFIRPSNTRGRHDFDGFYEQEIEFRRQLKYPPVSRIALLLLKGRNEEKVKFSADHVRRELEKRTAGVAELVIAGPAPAPLARAETMYRFQILLRTRQITRLSLLLAELTPHSACPKT